MAKKSKTQHRSPISKKDEIALFNRFLVLCLAYDMEEPEYKDNPERLLQKYDSMNAWLAAINDHVITINQVRKIIEEHIGQQIKF